MPFVNLRTAQRSKQNWQAADKLVIGEKVARYAPALGSRKVEEVNPFVASFLEPQSGCILTELLFGIGRRKKPALELADIAGVEPVLSTKQPQRYTGGDRSI